MPQDKIKRKRDKYGDIDNMGIRRPSELHAIRKGERTEDINLEDVRSRKNISNTFHGYKPSESYGRIYGKKTKDIELKVGPSEEVTREITKSMPKDSLFLKKKKDGKSKK